MIKTLNNKSFAIDVHPSDSVSTVKHQVVSRVVTPMYLPYLSLGGIELDEELAISHYNIKQGTVMCLLQRIQGGYKTNTIKFNSLTNEI